MNIAGGIRVSDPALDLAVVMAVLSSNIDAALPADTVFAGEVGLSGEIRAVSRIEQRISEAEKLGFKRIFVPLGNKKGFTPAANTEMLAKRIYPQSDSYRSGIRFQNSGHLPQSVRVIRESSLLTAIICPETGISEMFYKNCRSTEDLS